MSDKNNELIRNEKIQTGVALEGRRAPARGKKNLHKLHSLENCHACAHDDDTVRRARAKFT